MNPKAKTRNRPPEGRTGAAGPTGDGVRSDLSVRFEAAASGGIRVELASRVEIYYGDATRKQIAGVARTLGVEHGVLTVEDGGGLPFTIAARVEAAIRRAGAGEGREAMPERTARPGPSPRRRLRRSRLYLPGSEPKYMINAGLHRPDAVILDLEDSVHPGEKDAARYLVRNALAAVDFGAAERMVRINQLPLGLEDIATVTAARPDLVLVPKTETPDQVRAADEALEAARAAAGFEDPVWLMPILESALGVENAFAIASASPRVAALTLGLEDYTADLGVQKTTRGDESLYARMRVVNAARAAGVQPIDSVFADVSDSEGLLEYGRRSRGLGFEGMGCLHPRQIEVIHAAYAPSAEEIEKALRIVEAYEEARTKGLGVVSLGSKMIDPPVVQRALTVVERARDLGLTGGAGQ
jgi:citrate lyase subunit beta/citryl-CoA lyase